MNLHEFISKCLKKWHLNIVMLFFPYDNAKCTKTEQDFRTCNILQTAPHRGGGSIFCQCSGSNWYQFNHWLKLSFLWVIWMPQVQIKDLRMRDGVVRSTHMRLLGSTHTLVTKRAHVRGTWPHSYRHGPPPLLPLQEWLIFGTFSSLAKQDAIWYRYFRYRLI